MKIEVKPFGVTSYGVPISEYILSGENGISASLISYGAAVRSVILPNGKDVVLGFDRIEDYEAHDKYMGATIGRCANRIAKGIFRLNGKEYKLAQNSGSNHLHGGVCGFDKKAWHGEIKNNTVVFSACSEDGEEGYPGKLEVRVVYQLNGNALDIDYSAVSDADTVVNLTNHAYFNLDGHNSGRIENHLIKINADQFTEIGENGCSNGNISNVAGTCFDFRNYKRIGRDIDSNSEQIRFAGGYDHNFVLKDVYSDEMNEAAAVISGDVKLTVYTDQCGIHFYSGNYLDEKVDGKDHSKYHKRSGFVLEAQNWPDAVNHSSFPDAVLKKGEVYHRKVIYQFEF